MHELGLTRNIASIVSERCGAGKVLRVQLAVGPQACVEKSSLQFCFRIVAQGTRLADAALEFVDAPGDTLLIREFELEAEAA